MSKTIQLIIGSTRQNRLSPSIAAWIEDQVAKNDDFELEVIDLKNINLPFFNEPTSPAMGAGTSDVAIAWAAKIASADAVIILSPEYNAGYPAPLKNAIDYLKDEWKQHPVTIVTYGFGGGVSSAAQLKQVFTRLGSEIIESGVAIDIGAGILNETGGIKDPENSLLQYSEPLAVALDEITAYVNIESEALVVS
ncbi:NAD(P)H-dependent oxidoreductase [Candidatus Saccharibacteria bacterium]|nr:NAD(P)H-dependent oxidoreductase [Candidatus Saccharibacteria bacterium]